MKSFLQVAVGILLFVGAFVGILTLLNNVSRQPSSVLTSDCEPPCWYGIRPGTTTRWEALSILEQMKHVDKNSILLEQERNSIEIARINWAFQRPAVDSLGSVEIKDDHVAAITILTVGSLKVSDAFAKLGQPEQMWTHAGRGEAREFLEITLLYPAKGYAIEANIDLEGKPNFVEIDESTPVFRVTYLDPAMFEELLKTRVLIREPAVTRTGSAQDWPGLGKINFERR